MRLRVTYLDGREVEVVRTASALRAFESKHDMPVMDAIRTGRSFWADELAHSSLAQKREADPDLDTWLATVETITWGVPESRLLRLAETLGMHVDDSEQEADPTGGEAAPSPSSSSKSPSPQGNPSET